jgi:hypothetical protein
MLACLLRARRIFAIALPLPRVYLHHLLPLSAADRRYTTSAAAALPSPLASAAPAI